MSSYRAVSVAALLLVNGVLLEAQAGLRPDASGRGLSEVNLSIPQSPDAAAPATPAKPTVIRLDYGQPHLRGRQLHTDSLVPYDKPWRLGANNNTTLTTDVDIVLGGATLTKGTYVLYAIPSRGHWKLVVQRNVGQSPAQYADADDVTRIDLRHTQLAAPVESFTMWLIPSREPGVGRGELRFAWGQQQLSTTWSIK